MLPISRRAKASSVKAAGGSTGVLGAPLENGDATALTRVDTTRDTGSATVGVMTVAADVRGSIAGVTGIAGADAADCVADSTDDMLLSCTVVSAAGLSTTVLEVAPPRCPKAVPDVSGFVRLPVCPAEDVGVEEPAKPCR
jgi:hypothetical protein